MNNNENYTHYSYSMDRVDSSKVFNELQSRLASNGYTLTRDRVKHHADIGNNCAYELFKGDECIGYLNLNSGLYSDAYLYLEDLNGNRFGWSAELRPASDWNKDKNRVVIFKEN